MRILYVTSDMTFPPSEGLHQQTLATVSAISDAGHEVLVCGLVKKQPGAMPLTADFFRVAAAGPTVFYRGSQTIQGLKFRFGLSRRKAKLIKSYIASASPDIIHFEGAAAIGLYRFSERQRSILGFIDPGSRRSFRFLTASKSWSEKLRFAAALLMSLLLEVMSMPGRPVWHVVSCSDAKYFVERLRHRNTVVVPVALDTATPGTDTAHVANPSIIRIVCYCDLRQAHLRQSFLHSTQTYVRRWSSNAQIELVILGRVAGDAELHSALEGLDYSFIEWAPDRFEVLRRADVVLLPDLVGTGIKNRAVEALAVGKVVFGTDVAFEGIPVDHGKNCVILDKRDSLLEHRLLDSRELRRRMGDDGRRLIDDIYGRNRGPARWQAVYDAMWAERQSANYFKDALARVAHLDLPEPPHRQ